MPSLSLSVSLLLACCFMALPAFAKHVPDPAFKTLDGQTRRLSALRGKIVVVNFWATWCGPCQEELPRLAELAKNYADKPVAFVYLSIDEPRDRGRIPAVLARIHLSQESWIGADTDTMDRFGLGDVVPATIVLDDQGKAIERIRGEAREDDVRSALDWLLGGRSGVAPPTFLRRY